MSPKLGKNQSPILVKILMIQKNSPQKNHQNWWHFLVKKMSLNLEQNYSQNKVKILVIQQIFLQKCHRDWWKSDGITKICANFVENQGGLIYASKPALITLQKHFVVVGCNTRLDASPYRPRHLPELVDKSFYSSVNEDLCQAFDESIIAHLSLPLPWCFRSKTHSIREWLNT